MTGVNSNAPASKVVAPTVEQINADRITEVRINKLLKFLIHFDF